MLNLNERIALKAKGLTKRQRIVLHSLFFVLVPTLIIWTSFYAGMLHSRGEVRKLAESMSGEPVNSFTVCLTEMWEKSGELDPEWKGQRRWVLK